MIMPMAHCVLQTVLADFDMHFHAALFQLLRAHGAKLLQMARVAAAETYPAVFQPDGVKELLENIDFAVAWAAEALAPLPTAGTS